MKFKDLKLGDFFTAVKQENESQTDLYSFLKLRDGYVLNLQMFSICPGIFLPEENVKLLGNISCDLSKEIFVDYIDNE